MEEIFTLNGQVRIWVHVTLRYLYHEILNIDFYRDIIPAEYLEKSIIEPDCTLERLIMLSNLDVPSVIKYAIEYIFIVKELREMKYIYDTHKSIETLDYYVTGVELQRISEVLDKDMDFSSRIFGLCFRVV